MSQHTDSLAGRIAVVTGASSGIGEATARSLAARGAQVALIARRKERIDALAAAVRGDGGVAEAWAIDVTDRAAVERAAAEIATRLGRVDLVVNNAGVMLPNPIEETRHAQWQQQIDLNISGLMHVIGAFTAPLVAAGAAGGAADLINISSIGARNIFPAFAVYCATKAYVSHLSVHLRAELGARGVRVSCIEPGLVTTELKDHVDYQGARDWLAGATTWLAPVDVAETIAFTAALPKHVNLQTVTIMPTGQAA